MCSSSSKLLKFEEARYGCVNNPLNDPREIGSYCVDGHKCLHYNRSQMKYYIRRYFGNLNLDLNVGYGKDVRRIYDRVELMNNLLRWIVKSRFEPLYEYGIDFVCTRGVIEMLLKSPFVGGGESLICACRVRDIIYMNVVDTVDRSAADLEASEYAKRCKAWGFKFQQYMTANRPDGIPNLTSTRHQLEKFNIAIKNKIGPYNLLMEAEIDAVDPRSPDPGSGDPSCYVALKTSELMPTFNSTGLLQSGKCLEWWAQSLSTGIEEIVCGMRDDRGIVSQIETIETRDLPALCERQWSQRVCFNYCHNVLDYLRRHMTINDPRIVCKLEYIEDSEISVTAIADPTGPLKIIPSWYVTELQNELGIASPFRQGVLSEKTVHQLIDLQKK